MHNALQEAVQQTQQVANDAAIEEVAVVAEANEVIEPVAEIEVAPIAYAELPDFAQSETSVVAEGLVADQPELVNEPLAMI
ncbi:hypothetical protein ABTK26_20610, partial [Acinetobacter baumannii]